MARFFARSRAKKPGFPLQVLGSADALPVGFPLQSLAHGSSETSRIIACGNYVHITRRSLCMEFK
jgi:hypothetical protein